MAVSSGGLFIGNGGLLCGSLEMGREIGGGMVGMQARQRLGPGSVTPGDGGKDGGMFVPDLRRTVAATQHPAHGTTDMLPVQRSEEHTSELQSLMRISSAAFCLKK